MKVFYHPDASPGGGAPATGAAVTDPNKAGDGQLYKGDINDKGHDDFQKAREAANEKLRQRQADEAKQAQQKIESDKQEAVIDTKAKALVEGIDIRKIAEEVDSDLRIAEKMRQFRTMTPESTQKLTDLRKRVEDRRNKRLEAILNDPELAAELNQAPAGSPQTEPAQQPAGQQKETSAQQNPGETVPGATIQQQGKPAQPEQQLSIDQLLDSKLKPIREELNKKLQAEQQARQAAEQKATEANKKLQQIEQERQQEVQKQVRTNFNMNAKKLGIPEDLLDIAFGNARQIVDTSQRNMTWDEIFTAMKTKHPSLFRGGAAAQPAGDGTGQAPKKTALRPSTGTDAGGARPAKPPESTQKKGDHNSFDDAKKALGERVKAKYGA